MIWKHLGFFYDFLCNIYACNYNVQVIKVRECIEKKCKKEKKKINGKCVTFLLNTSWKCKCRSLESSDIHTHSLLFGAISDVWYKKKPEKKLVFVFFHVNIFVPYVVVVVAVSVILLVISLYNKWFQM